MLRKDCKGILLAVLFLFAVRAVSLASFSKNDAGTSTAQFLKLGAGARAAGMGEAFAAVADDADSIYWNPAGLNNVEGKSLSVMHAMWFEDTSYEWASYAQRIGGLGVAGIGVQYFSYGSIPGVDFNGLETEDFSPSDLAVSLSFARAMGNIGLGVNAKYISSTIKESAAAFAFDLGAQYWMSDRVVLGAAVQNVGTAMKFVDEGDALPLNVKLGGSCVIQPGWLAALDVNAPIDNELVYNAGTEYRYRINGTMSATARLGYTTRNKDTGGTNGLSAGLGFNFKGYAVDYAFVPYGDLGNTQRVSLGIKF
jgi:long-subunit fatty acid transport protein